MLEECGVNLANVKCDADSLDSTFAMHFLVTENVPLPLVALAHARMASLPMAYFKENDPTKDNVEAMWRLEGNVLNRPSASQLRSGVKSEKKADFSGP